LALAVAAVATTLALVRCDLAEEGPQQTLVVEAFLETGRPLPAVVLRTVQPRGRATDRTEDAARGATVRLRLDDTTYAYAADPEVPGRYVPVGDVPPVPAGVPFQLTANWDGERAVAEGRTPPPIAIDEVCLEIPDDPVRAVLVDSVRRDSLDIPAEQGYIYPIEVSMAWPVDRAGPGPDPADDSAYWVRAQLRPTAQFSSRVVNFFLQPAEVRQEHRFRASEERYRWTGVYAVPVDSADDPLPEHRLTTALVRGDAAFADFATSRTDPGRREPTSNVRGGLGIATAIALDSLRQRITPGTPACTSP
jgi:hypothetical protein